MRVKDIDKTSADIPKNIAVDDKKRHTKQSVEFHRQITSLNQTNYENHIKTLTDEIYKQGQVVAEKVDINEVQKYRELITQLLNETASNSYAFSKMERFDSRGRRKVYALIRKVNNKLDELTAEVLKDQKDNIKMLSIVDDVKGLLVDLFL